MRRSDAARISRDRQVEASPPELDRTRLSGKSGAEARKDRQHCGKSSAEPFCRIPIIFARSAVVGEGFRARELVRCAVEARGKAVRIENREQPAMKSGNA